jgi:phosphatidylinositol kinase/protein kinase (PI-3  family)
LNDILIVILLRHCDNILLTPAGLIFHIDFGMMLGKDYGVAATIPFTLTQQMLDVIGGKGIEMRYILQLK